MKITIVGTGYVGLVTGACLAEVGHQVVAVDIDQEKVKALQQGIIPIYEPGLEAIVKNNLQKQRLQFSHQLSAAMQEAAIIFIAVGTPSTPQGEADLSHVMAVAKTIGDHLQNGALIVTKSTVPVGTTYQVQEAIQERLTARKKSIPFEVASNPEFLKEGTAVNDFLQPDRIIVGLATEKTKARLAQLYQPFTDNGHLLVEMDILSAELTKYAANAMLATKISFMNEMAQLCERVGANVQHVRQGLGSDPRIGAQFIAPGVGYGGSCFPKDVSALIRIGEQNDYPLKIVTAVHEVNAAQKQVLYDKIKAYFTPAHLAGKKIALWGLAFKPNTDDIREASSLVLIEKLLAAGCIIKAYDPVATNNAQKILGTRIDYATDLYEAVKGADALAIVTEWGMFQQVDLTLVKKHMQAPVVFDGRNIFEAQVMHSHGFTYHGIGFQ